MPNDGKAGRVVLLTGWGLEHRHVALTLHRSLGERLGAMVLVAPPRGFVLRRAARRARGYLRRYTARQIASRVHQRIRAGVTRQGAKQEAALRRILFAGDDPPPLPPELVRVVPSHNGPECQALLRDLRPDVIAIYGTGIIRTPVIRLAGIQAVNMHTGLSPRYRGADTVFWPLHNEEPEWIGVTIHLLDEGIDAGAVLRTVRPEIGPDDDVHTLFAKCVEAGAPAYAETVADILAGRARAQPQRLEEGREYRFVDRTVAAERRVERLLREGLLSRHGGNGS